MWSAFSVPFCDNIDIAITLLISTVIFSSIYSHAFDLANILDPQFAFCSTCTAVVIQLEVVWCPAPILHFSLAMTNVLPLQSWVIPPFRRCSQGVPLKAMMCTLQSICFEHFLESLADQSSSFGVSKPDFLSTFVNHPIVCVGVTEHQKAFLLAIPILAIPYSLRYTIVQFVSTVFYYSSVSILHSEFGCGRC